MIDGIIFDVDGTILDTMEMWRNLDIEFLNRMNVTPEEDYPEIVNKMTLEEGVAYTKNHFRLSLTEEEILGIIREMAGSFYSSRAELKPHVREFLAEAKRRGIPMSIATSSHMAFIESALQRNGVLNYFNGIFSGSDYGINKSRPDLYFMAAESIGTEPENTWVFEDAYHALHTAREAGFKVVGVYDASNRNFLEEMKREADLYMDDLKDYRSFFSFAEGFCAEPAVKKPRPGLILS